jgi:hypothetical protein
VSIFVNVKINAFLEMPGATEISNFDSSGHLKPLRIGYYFSHFCTLRKVSGTLIGFHTCYGTGFSITLLVANDDRIFKISVFQTYWKIVKLTHSQLGTLRKFKRE